MTTARRLTDVFSTPTSNRSEQGGCTVNPTAPVEKERKPVATDENKQVQDQMLDAIKQSQDAALQAVSAWSESVAQLAPNLPDLPKLPMVGELPKPSELSDQYFEFAHQLLTSQRKFIEKLMAALPGQDKTSD
jgi:hypothetical protein